MKLPSPQGLIRVVFFTLSCLALIARGDSAGMKSLLPASREVPGWIVHPKVKSPTYCAKPSDLPFIYDGGDGLYTQHGVVEAISQIYLKIGSKPTTEVVIHRMKSAKMARAFMKYWSTQGGSKPIARPAVKDEAFLAAEGVTTAGYLSRGAYFITVKVTAKGKDGQTAATSFLKALSKKIKP